MNQQQLARGLGWFSIGLGVAELAAPRKVGKTIGLRDNSKALRLTGLREITSGLGILSDKKQAGWLWSRVAGDVMDLSMLGTALRSGSAADQRKVTGAIAAVAGIAVLDVLCSVQQTRQNGNGRNGQRQRASRPAQKKPAVRKSIIINLPAEEIYAFWRDFENLPRFMNHLKSVKVQDDKRSHWVAKGPAGSEVEWDAEIIAEEPNQFIAWRSLPGATVENAGSVRFERATGGRGTVVRVELDYRPPAGVVGATIAKLFGEAPEKQIPVDLHRIKQLLETGEIARTEGQPAGRPMSTSARYDDWLRT